ncbi:hypothetical protein GIB67_024023, partial [Kingdonia uniflora]
DSGNSSNFVYSASRCLRLTIFPISLGSLRSSKHQLSFSVSRLDRLPTVSGSSSTLVHDKSRYLRCINFSISFGNSLIPVKLKFLRLVK